MPPRPERTGDRHGWSNLRTHLRVHRQRLDDLRDDFVLSDDLSHRFISPRLLDIRGRISCRHGVFVDVRKTLEVDDRERARTVAYSYHAGLVGPTDRPIFRYDNAHPHPGHADEHHKHVFDHATWRETTSPQWVGHAGWPHLSEVIEELRAWWEDVGRHLDLGDGPNDELR